MYTSTPVSVRTGMGHWRMALEQKPHDVGLGESRSVKLGESAPPSIFQCYRMELRPAAYVMKRGTNPSDAIPYKRGRNHATGQVPCLHNTHTVQKTRFTAIKHRYCLKSLTSVLTHGQLHPTSVSVGHLVSFITALYTDRIM